MIPNTGLGVIVDGEEPKSSFELQLFWYRQDIEESAERTDNIYIYMTTIA